MPDPGEDVRDSVSIGQDVYDSASERVGVVGGFNRRTGWIVIETGRLYAKDLYVPFRLVANIDQRELYLARTTDELARGYAAPPPRTVELREVAGRTLARTSEPSGYDGRPLVVHEVDLDRARRSVATGDRVWTADRVEVGRIEQYDPTTGFMIVEKGTFSRQDLMIPVALVEDVERRSADVRLVVSRAELLRMRRVEPVSLVVVAAGIGGPRASVK